MRDRGRGRRIEVRAELADLRAQCLELGIDRIAKSGKRGQVVPRALQDAVEARRILAEQLVALVQAGRRGRLARWRSELEVALGERAARRDEYVAARIAVRRVARIDRDTADDAFLTAERSGCTARRQRDALDLADRATCDHERPTLVQGASMMEVHADPRVLAPLDPIVDEHEERDREADHRARD